MKPVFRDDLDRLVSGGCSMAGCDHANHGQMFLHPACHVGGRIEVSYRLGSGRLLIACRECKKPIGYVAVAERDGIVPSDN